MAAIFPPLRPDLRSPNDTPQAPGFLYTRAGVIAIGVGLTGAGYALYYGLQANGVDPIWAGKTVQTTSKRPENGQLGRTVIHLDSYTN